MMGTFCGASAMLLVVLLGNGIHSDQEATVYAAIIGGFFAIFAVWGALYSVRLQIEAQTKAADDQRKARLQAERAVLPLYLSHIIETSEAMILSHITGERLDKSALSLPIDMISGIKACIECSQGEARQQLVDLLAIYQICLANAVAEPLNGQDAAGRLTKMKRSIDKWNRISNIMVCCSLYARASNLLSFARGEIEDPTVTPIFECAKMLARTLSETGTNGGWLLASDPEYEAYLKLGLDRGRIGYSHPYWRRH
jgi:hypothetical protein